MEITNSMDTFMIVVFLATGVYCVRLFFTERGSKKLPENKLFYLNNCELKKCTDPQGYLQFILPKVLVLGVLLIISGALILTDNLLKWNSTVITILLIIFPLASFGWYVTALKKGAARFWKK